MAWLCLQLLCEFRLPPLGPHEVGAPDGRVLLIRVLAFGHAAHKALLALTVPPNPAPDYLSDRGMVVSTAHKHSEELVLVGL